MVESPDTSIPPNDDSIKYFDLGQTISLESGVTYDLVFTLDSYPSGCNGSSAIKFGDITLKRGRRRLSGALNFNNFQATASPDSCKLATSLTAQNVGGAMGASVDACCNANIANNDKIIEGLYQQKLAYDSHFIPCFFLPF